MSVTAKDLIMHMDTKILTDYYYNCQVQLLINLDLPLCSTRFISLCIYALIVVKLPEIHYPCKYHSRRKQFQNGGGGEFKVYCLTIIGVLSME